MTLAVCVRCGAMKLGALTPCDRCEFEPNENIDKARSMVLTDRILSREDLQVIGQRIRDGLPVTYPEDAVAEFIALLEQGAGKSSIALRVGCAAVTIVIIGLLALVVSSCL